ncbi:NAD(P)-dependent oxidoreductase [Dietzia cinnamea]|uniref:NAD-dependent epimerase/dehydratase family protein n=1 Tax=Dietzia cinnamea TaxID=321318 RepID=UPI00195D2190|nr:NAD(P)-dependent oxidoreductase [Dietzia cinnamea]
MAPSDEFVHTIAVVGATGFVGSAVVDALAARGARVRAVKAPRIERFPDRATDESRDRAIVQRLQAEFIGCSAVVNAAGVSDSGSTNLEILWGANAALPALVAAAAQSAGARAVHISSAAVQGRKAILDDSDMFDGFSLYARSKIAGERLARLGNKEVTIYRPPGVHGPNRPVTRSVSQLARSRFSSVASPGTDNAPHSLINNVADAVAFLCTSPVAPPKTVTHPPEGLTTAELLRLLGGSRPVLIPRRIAGLVVALAFGMSRFMPSLASQARRLEVLWFGQEQAPSWLTGVGWFPVASKSEWIRIGERIANDNQG